MDEILLQISSATMFAKAAVDMARLASPALPGWVPPLLAVLVAILALLLLAVAGGALLTQAVIAQAMLAGFLGGATAVGVTELARHADAAKRDEAR